MQRLYLRNYKLENAIISYCKIKNNTVWLNGELLLQSDGKEDGTSFLSLLYRHFEVNYPKFFKMDKLCKLGTLATELLARNTTDFALLPKNGMAIVFANRSSSLESDRTHAKTIADKTHYFPSPSVFVYTLPNIVIGEIAIRHKITGENCFFISEQFNAELMHNYSTILLQNTNTSSVLCGWVNADNDNLEAFVYCLKNPNFKQESAAFFRTHELTNILHLYNT
jgi:hypothetical protein